MLGKNSEKLPPEVNRQISTYLTVDELLSLRKVSASYKKTVEEIIEEEKTSQLSYDAVSLIKQDEQKEITFKLMQLVINCNKIKPSVKSGLIGNFIDNIKIYRKDNIQLSLTYITKLLELARQKVNDKLTQNEIENFKLW